VSALPRLRLLSDLHDVRRVSELAAHEEVEPTGHAALQPHLPGQGWPVGSLIELLQDEPTRHVWQLVLPALAQITQKQAGPVVLVDPPLEPFLPALQAQGLPASRLLRITTRKPQARLWAAEQALRCADVAAVLAWLPQVKNMELHRLHLAASGQQRLLFVMRPMRAQGESSPARLRLAVEAGEGLQVRILKRRGPPLEQPVALPPHPERLAALLASRKGRGLVPSPQPQPLPQERSHVLDRPLSLA
jgi:protein ImuA